MGLAGMLSEWGLFRKKLEDYYIQQEISALNFRCKYQEECGINGGNSVPAKAAYVGEKYGVKGIPKLLFLSLDPGESDKDPAKRTLKGVFEATLSDGLGKKNQHWYRTHQFAAVVFHELLGADFVGKPYDEESVKEAQKYFAHTNSAKCCQNKENNKQADYPLFRNCLENVLGELEVLSPDILVTQGQPARDVINHALKNGTYTSTDEENISHAGKGSDFAVLTTKNDRKIIWVHHYHPRCYGRFKKNLESYLTYAKTIKKIQENT